MLEGIIVLAVALLVVGVLIIAATYFVIDEVDSIDPTKHEFDYYEDDKDER